MNGLKRGTEAKEKSTERGLQLRAAPFNRERRHHERTAAQRYLDSIPLAMRGAHTGLEPLKVATFFDVWRVDQIDAI